MRKKYIGNAKNKKMNNYDHYKTEAPEEGEQKITYYCPDCCRHFDELGNEIEAHEAHPCYEDEVCVECIQIFIKEILIKF